MKQEDKNNIIGYGKQVIANLSKRLKKRYGDGFSATNLQNFRKFYQVYSNRFEIQYPPGVESTFFPPQLTWSPRSIIRVS